LEGQAIVLFVFAIAGAEVSIGLALIVWAYRQTGSMDPSDYNLLK
jgi:NADH-quinone oxidoreductase subunit K